MADYEMEIISEGEESKDILRCLKTLLGIRAGTQPVDRDLGISWECLDHPPETAETLFLTELETKVERYEPRAEIKEVTFSVQSDGMMVPRIIFAKRGDGY